MGTSTSNGGPSDPQWGGHKTKVTTSCESGGIGADTARDVLSDYVQKSGGSRNVSQGSGKVSSGKSAQRTGRNIARFANRVQEAGLDQALQDFGLGDLVGESAESVVYSLSDRLCDDGGPLDEVDGRKALLDIYGEMLDEAESFEDVEDALQEEMQPDALEKVLTQFFGRYLYHEFCRVHYERLAKNEDEETVQSYMDDIKDFIQVELEKKTFDKDLSGIDWEGNEGENIIEEIHERTLNVFE